MIAVHVARRPCVIVGTCPATDAEVAWHPDSASARRLAELAACEPNALRNLFALDNLVPYAKASSVALGEAAALYTFVPTFYYLLAGHAVLAAFGRRAHAALGASALPWSASKQPPLAWYETVEGVTAAVLPHPSGKNRWYNDKRCKAAASAFLRAAAWQGSTAAHALWVRAYLEAR